MSDNVPISDPPATASDEILARLARIELLLVSDRIESGAEANEVTGDPAAPSDVFAAGAEAAPALTLAQRLERFIDDLDLPNFKGAELTPYWSRLRNGVRNSVPPEALWPNIAPTFAVLQRLRREVGAPVTLLSTFRSVPYNNAIGGAGDSQHTHFRAIDFSVATGTPAQWAARLKSYRGQQFVNPHTGVPFVYRGGVGLYPSFVHVDTRGHNADW